MKVCRRALATVAAAATAPAGAGRAPAAGRMAAWRAHAYGASGAGEGALRLEEARVPARRGPDDVLVRVHATSINPIDLAILRGYGSRVLNVLRQLEGGEGVEFPLTPGRDFAGVVTGAGPDAGLSPGTRVWGVAPPHRTGAHAQYVLVKKDWVGPAPAALDDLQAGGALYAGLTACAALRAAGLPADGSGGARVLLLGLGGAGQAALQLLARAGHGVVAVCAREQAALAAGLGAAAARDRHDADHAERLRRDGPFDVVLDCAGLGGAGAAALPCAWGRYVTLSSPLLRRTDELSLAAGTLAAVTELARDTLAARGADGIPCPGRVRWAFFEPRASDIELLRRLAEKGQFIVEVERSWGWRDAAEAYSRAAAGHARGKLLLDFRQP